MVCHNTVIVSVEEMSRHLLCCQVEYARSFNVNALDNGVV